MPVTRTFTVRPTKDADQETFKINNWPVSAEEAIKAWGNKRVLNSINGSSADVQAEGKYRGLRTRKDNPMTAAKAAEEMQDWLPSEGGTRGMTKSERLKKDASALTKVEQLEYYTSIGLTKEQAQAAYDRANKS